MIISNTNTNFYIKLQKPISEIIGFCNHIKNKPCGKYVLDENIHAFVQEYNTISFESSFPETHRKYIDLHFMVKGAEKIGYSDVKYSKKIGDYNKEKDYQEYLKNNLETLILREEDYAIFYPNDVHATHIMIRRSNVIRKIVVKIKTNL